MTEKKKQITVVEFDSRDARFQTGIGRYMDTLIPALPSNVRVFRVILLYSPEYVDIHIERAMDGLYIRHPAGFPSATLNEAICNMIGPMLAQMPNVILKCNCLGIEGLVYLLRARMYCKTMGVLHCLPRVPQEAQNVPNPYYNMDHVVLVCRAGYEYMKRVNNKRPVTVIYNGLNAPAVKKKQKDDDGVFRFLFANGWAQHKGLKRIVPAIRTVAKQRKIQVFVLGGGAEIDDDLKNMIADLPIEKVGLLTDAEEIDKYYYMCDCALFASYSEACSYAGIEAMSHNLPIISCDEGGGLTEMLGKKAAIVVGLNEEKELDVEAYAAAMMRVIDSPSLRLRLGIASYARYRERYTLKKMTEMYMDLYNKLTD